jgi:hypothetical protein
MALYRLLFHIEKKCTSICYEKLVIFVFKRTITDESEYLYSGKFHLSPSMIKEL